MLIQARVPVLSLIPLQATLSCDVKLVSDLDVDVSSLLPLPRGVCVLRTDTVVGT